MVQFIPEIYNFFYYEILGYFWGVTLKVIPTAKPIRQKVRRFYLDQHQIIQAKVDNLLATGFIKEVKYPEWMANVVVVLKKGDK